MITVIENINSLDWRPIECTQELLRFVGIDKYVIAGGYFRDVLNNVPPKDVDVFIPGDQPKPPEGIRKYDDIGDAIYLEHKGVLINLIRCRYELDVAGVIKRMDIGFCQIGMNIDGKLICTDAYVRDSKRRELTVMFEPKSESSQKHISRLQERYPDFRLVPFETLDAALR